MKISNECATNSITLNTAGQFELTTYPDVLTFPAVRFRSDSVRIGCTQITRDAARELIRVWEEKFPETGATVQ
jgi:hypothetical protein